MCSSRLHAVPVLRALVSRCLCWHLGELYATAKCSHLGELYATAKCSSPNDRVSALLSHVWLLQFVLRYCNFLSLTMPGQAYDELLSETDVAMLPWLYRFQVHWLVCICLAPLG